MKTLISTLIDSLLSLALSSFFYLGCVIIYFDLSTNHSNWFSLYCLFPYSITLFCFLVLKDRILPGNYSFEKS